MDLETARSAAMGRSGPDPVRGRRSSAGWDRWFQFRYVVYLTLVLTGFALSWVQGRSGHGQRVWLTLPQAVSRVTHIGLHSAIVTMTGATILLATAAALLRTWATAYIGPNWKSDSAPKSDVFTAAGPYRFVRNPLSLGMVLHTLALCVLMSWMGAAFTLGSTLLLQWAAIAAEERSLAARDVAGYGTYVARVPRLLPRLRGTEKGVAAEAHWRSAVVREIYFWGAAASFSAFGSTYNAQPILQGLLVSLGVAIVVQGLMRRA